MDEDTKNMAAIIGVVFIAIIVFMAGIGITVIGLLWLQKALGL